MSDPARLFVDYLGIWTDAIERKNGAGRGNGGKLSFRGIEKLRSLILDLAVRGKLLPQDPNDEPASEFLRSLGFRPKSSNRELPLGWAEAPLTAFGDFTGGLTPSKSVSRYWGSGYPWVSPKDMGVDTIDQTEDEITQHALDETTLRAVPAGSLLMVARSGILRRKFPVAIATIECTTNQDMKALVLKPGVNNRYLQVILKGFQPRILTDLVKRGMTVESLIFAEFVKALWPIPPLAEQKRIVAKVDELMALCSALEKGQREAMAAHEALVSELLATLVNSLNADDLAANWSRIETHFDTLFTTEGSIDALKQTTVELAVRGKLVRREKDNGMPAKRLIDQINAERLRLAESNSTRSERTKSYSDDSPPFEIPASWHWARIGELALFTQYGTSQKAFEGTEGVPVLAMGNIQSGKVDTTTEKRIPFDSLELPELYLEPGDLLYNRTNSYELVGKTGLFEGEPLQFTFASYLIRIRLFKEATLPRFVNLTMNSAYFRTTQVEPKITKQTGQANVNGSSMRSMFVPLPPVEEQQKIVETVELIFKFLEELSMCISTSNEIRVRLADEMANGKF